MPPIFRTPYLFYESCLKNHIKKEQNVLEVCAGTGLHTYSLLQTRARVVATDISVNALKVLVERSTREEVDLVALTADMEALPFDNNSFDVVVCAGSLSYGEPDLVDAEIRRVLRPGGTFICVDSLNHNPVYRFNRWLHYMTGSRTKSTLIRMPTIERINKICRGFDGSLVRYFGAISYVSPVLAFLVGQHCAGRISDMVDRLVNVRRSAFKFVLVAISRL
jgi:ubiquinone/menaquinone biosynthesis C-methylase UbiE